MFKVDYKYSAREIANIVDTKNINKSRVAGKYATTYFIHENVAYILMNIGVPGRTGHNFNNQYNKKLSLITWYGRPKSHSTQKSIKRLLSGKLKTCIFVRWNNKEKFTFIGNGMAIGFIDKVPILIPSNKLSYSVEVKFVINNK